MKLTGSIARAADLKLQLANGEPLTVATSYPETMGAYAAERGYSLTPNWIVGGGCEGYVAAERSDLAFDIAKTGSTIAANNLTVIDEDDELNIVVLDGVQYEPRLVN